MIRNVVRTYTLSLMAILAFTFVAAAQTSPSTTDFPNVKIGNFGQMDENYYRGAQPLAEDFASLAALGVKTVIDLRNDPVDYEKAAVEAAGMTYINVPMSGWKKPKDADIETFLKLASDPATGKFYVHCKAGIHRTGITAAIYRMTKYDWGYDQSYKEMKNYNFSTGLVHGALKSYVRKYAARLEGEKSIAVASTAAAQSN